MVAIFGFGHPEIWPTGDAGVARAAGVVFLVDGAGDDPPAHCGGPVPRGDLLLGADRPAPSARIRLVFLPLAIFPSRPVRPMPLPELVYIYALVGFFLVTFIVANVLARAVGYKE